MLRKKVSHAVIEQHGACYRRKYYQRVQTGDASLEEIPQRHLAPTIIVGIAYHKAGQNKPKSVIRPYLLCFLLLLIAFCFYKASNACFLLEIARYYSQKQQATSALLKIQNAISPNYRIGIKKKSTAKYPWLIGDVRELPVL